ncbi:MAG: hypothetical protein Q9221_008499 [Calogaya cf. arnoldii]
MAGEKAQPLLRAQSENDSDQTEEHKNGDASRLTRTFNPKAQSWEIFREQFWRLLFTTVLVALVIVTLTIYDDRQAVAHDDKITFNTIITVLNLALGLNFFEAFKDMAKVLRWRVLANRKFTVRETDLILGGESLIKLFTLMRESMKKPLTSSLAKLASYAAETLKLAQASAAMIGLTYSMDNGVDSTTITTSRGNVSVPRLDCYYNKGICTTLPDQPPEIAQNEAHAYGELTEGLEGCPYATDDDIFNSPQDCEYFYSKRDQEFAYRFAEYNPQDRGRRAYPYRTRRLIKVSSGQCYRSSPRGNDVYFAPFKDEPRSMVVLRFSNGTDDELVSVDRSDTAFDSTTYAYLGEQAPQNATAVACGPRCIWVYAIRWNGTVTHRGTDVFKCPITVSNVTNVDDPAHIVPDDTARMAAASIALTGRYTIPNGPMRRYWQQYQLYPYGSHWETNNLSNEEIGSRMAEFAIGSLTAMATLNKHTSIPGTLPTLGFHLSVQWRYVIALIACIANVHCFLVGLIVFIARPVVIPGDSNLITARLLQGIVGKIGDKGGLLKEKEIADAIQQETSGAGDGRGTIGYGVRDRAGGILLEVGEGMVRRKDLAGGKFPKGEYA